MLGDINDFDLRVRGLAYPFLAFRLLVALSAHFIGIPPAT
jgi:hypothetical protein